MQLTSTAFKAGEAIPARHSYDGGNVSPPLAWTGVPNQAKSLALIMDDPDAPRGTWVHWLVYGLAPDARDLKEDLPKTQSLPGGARQGLNDFRLLGYGGPAPPPGNPHRYFFRIYALDTVLDLRPGASRKELDQAMQSHVLATGELMGTYKR